MQRPEASLPRPATARPCRNGIGHRHPSVTMALDQGTCLTSTSALRDAPACRGMGERCRCTFACATFCKAAHARITFTTRFRETPARRSPRAGWNVLAVESAVLGAYYGLVTHPGSLPAAEDSGKDSSHADHASQEARQAPGGRAVGPT